MNSPGIDSHAFASPVSRQDHTELIEDIADKVVRRRMTAPAVVFLESVRPISRLAGQALLCASPLLSLFVTAGRIDTVCDLLEDRRNIERLLEAIERREHESPAIRKQQ